MASFGLVQRSITVRSVVLLEQLKSCSMSCGEELQRGQMFCMLVSILDMYWFRDRQKPDLSLASLVLVLLVLGTRYSCWTLF